MEGIKKIVAMERCRWGENEGYVRDGGNSAGERMEGMV
jgi:hypothetical protein